jgi:hypothetical protein
VRSIHVEAPASAFVPLIHSRPATGLESKFSLEYATAAPLLDGPPGLRSFTDDAVARPEVEDCAGPLADAVLGADWDSAWSLMATDATAGQKRSLR